MTRLAAVLWDVDGTLAETERDGHRVAFNRAFEDFDLPWRWNVDRYGELLNVAGGRERLLADLEARTDGPPAREEREALAARLHARKNARYAELVAAGRLSLREGVRELISECEAGGVPMGITTTTSRSNLEALMTSQLGPGWASRFAAVVVGEDVSAKKPDPEVFRRALGQLGIAPGQALAIEDSPDGVAAAFRAGVPVIVTRSRYFADHPVRGALAVGPGLHTRKGWWPALPGKGMGRVNLDDLVAWHTSASAGTRPG